jgi:hypothetical protein
MYVEILHSNKMLKGCDTAQAVIFQLLIIKAWYQFQVSPGVISG